MVKRHGTSEKCKSCRYRKPLGWTSGETTFCDYIGATGHSRGCPGGDECTKWKPIRQPKPRRELHLPPENEGLRRAAMKER